MIIGLAGRAGAGKDSIGRVLIEQRGLQRHSPSRLFKRVAFADGVKEFAAALFGWDLTTVQSADFKRRSVVQRALNGAFSEYPTGERNVTGRELLQRIGTDAARKIFGDDCWVKVALAKCVGGAIGSWARECATCGHLPSIHGYPQSGDTSCEQCPCKHYVSTAEQHYVITDVRFPNELAAIKVAGGKVIRLNRAESLATRHDFIKDKQPHEPCRCSKSGEPLSGPGAHVTGCGALKCDYTFPDGDWCALPPSAHPASYSADQHPSEVSLPDEGDCYDGVATGSLEENTATVLALVKGWL